MSLDAATIDHDNLSCPRCHSGDVVLVCTLRGGSAFTCDVCDHRWEAEADHTSTSLHAADAVAPHQPAHSAQSLTQ